MTLLVRDEEDIISSNIAFHLSRGVDHVIAMDNRSQDRTADILHHYARAGRLTYLHQPQDDYSQGVWVSEMARRACRELGADWVINADADEFWWPEGGDLKTVLAAVPAEVEAVRVERTNFIPPGREGGGFFASAMVLRERVSLNTLGEPLPPKVCHRAADDVVVGQGNHDVSRQGRLLTPAPAAMSILHFPVRSYAQFANKIAKGGAAYARNPVLPDGVGHAWRRLYERQRRGQLEASFDELALDEEAVAQGLASGRLIRDVRLRDALPDLWRAAVA